MQQLNNLQIVDFLRSKVVQLEILKLAQHMLEEKMWQSNWWQDEKFQKYKKDLFPYGQIILKNERIWLLVIS